ncbi:MAG: DUF3108 domain-containing protein [Candidatus Omnitrophota bacterium]
MLLFAVFSLQLVLSGCANTGKIRYIGRASGVTKNEVTTSMATKPQLHYRKRFTFLMAWNGIPIGSVVAEIGDIIRYRGRDVYVVTLITRSNKFLSKIYKVEDKYISYVDTETMTSRRYEADRKEGNYRKHVIVEYDFDKNEAIYTNLTDGSVKRCAIEKDVQDPLSATFYFMTVPVKVDDEIRITVNLNEKNYKVFGKVESLNLIKLPGLGSFPAFRIRPYAILGNERFKKGRGWLYVIADKRRYPLYGVVLIPFGKVTSTLAKVEDI